MTGPAVAAYAVTLVTFLVVDGIWLFLMASRFYRAHLGSLMAEQPSWPAAVAFYPLFAFGLTVLAVWPALESGSVGRAALLGGTLGLVAYGTYDLTNQATLKGWPAVVTLVDLAWGTVLSSVVAGLAVWIIRRFA